MDMGFRELVDAVNVNESEMEILRDAILGDGLDEFRESSVYLRLARFLANTEHAEASHLSPTMLDWVLDCCEEAQKVDIEEDHNKEMARRIVECLWAGQTG